MTDAAITAKAIRKELKLVFPGVKFSVRSSTFSMGDAVDIHWTDGPTREMVEQYTDKYQYSDFDGYTDMITIDRSSLPAGVPGAKFVQCSREISDAYRIGAIKAYEKAYNAKISDPYSYGGPDYIKFYDEYVFRDFPCDDPADFPRLQAEKRESEFQAQQAAEKAEAEKAAVKQEAKKEAGREFIEKLMKENPIKAGENYVLIHWSENPAFYAWGDDSLKLSIKAADLVLSSLDKKVHEENEGGYDKTKYSIVSPSGEILFTDRYDLGDMLGGLVAVLRQYGQEKLLPASMQEITQTDAKKAVSNFLANLKKDSKKSLEKVPADPDRVPVIEANVSRLPPDLLSVLASGIAARQLLANPFGPGVTEEIKKTPQYKRAHIAAVLSQAFRAKS